MNIIEERIEYYYNQYLNLNSNNAVRLPGETYILEDGSVLSLPRADGDNRYQYGEGGFNLWTYTSGNIHANRGLFSLFLRGGEGREQNAAFAFGLKEGERYRIIPLTAALDADAAEYFVVFTQAETFYFSIAQGMLAVLHVYAAPDDTLTFTAILRNMSSGSREVSLCSYLNPFLREGLAVSEEDKWFRSCEQISDEKGLRGFFFKVNMDVSRTLSVVNYGAVDREIYTSPEAAVTGSAATTSRLDWLGGMQYSLSNSTALRNGRFANGQKVTAFNDTAVAGEMVFASLPSGQSVTLHETLVFRRNETTEYDFFNVRKRADLEGLCEELKAKYQADAAHEKIRMTFGGNEQAKLLSAFVPHLVKQVDFCASISGYVQLSSNSLVGIRDIFQAIEGNLYSEPIKAKAKMLEALSFIDPSGRAPRQYALPSVPDAAPPMDLRPFIDQGVWVIDTIMTYLRVTGDFSLLDEKCGYYEIIDESRKITKKSEMCDSVLDHMFRIMSYLLQNTDEKTHCIHALYGDWNDALDGLGVCADGKQGYGTGVSVMVSLQVYKNLTEMAELLEFLSSKDGISGAEKALFDEKLAQYRNARTLLREGLTEYAVVNDNAGNRRIIHGWGDDRSYMVGSFCDNDGMSRVGVTSNAFWVLSGLYEEDKSYKDIILKAFETLDSTYGLKTFEPGFARTAKGFGRIGKLPMGTAENGAVYVHASAFGVRALFGMGETKEAWRQLVKLLPVFHDRVSLSPYVCPNSYGENISLGIDGESMTDWQTGSSNVILKCLINDVFGFRPAFTGLYICPAGWCPYDEMTLETKYRGIPVKIRIHGTSQQKTTFRVNGVERSYDASHEGIFLGERELRDIVEKSCVNPDGHLGDEADEADEADKAELTVEVY